MPISDLFGEIRSAIPYVLAAAFAGAMMVGVTFMAIGLPPVTGACVGGGIGGGFVAIGVAWELFKAIRQGY